MSYIVASDIYNYGIYGLTASDANTATVTQFITDAQSIVDSYLSGLYTVPLTDVPDLIKKITRDLAGCELLIWLYSQQGVNISEWITIRQAVAMSQLKKISTNDIGLVHSGTVLPIANIDTDLQATFENVSSAINLDDEFNWHTPQSILDGISDNRNSDD